MQIRWPRSGRDGFQFQAGILTSHLRDYVWDVWELIERFIKEINLVCMRHIYFNIGIS